VNIREDHAGGSVVALAVGSGQDDGLVLRPPSWTEHTELHTSVAHPTDELRKGTKSLQVST
jgi:hypothetical protein